jgi:hypothetical protein
MYPILLYRNSVAHLTSSKGAIYMYTYLYINMYTDSHIFIYVHIYIYKYIYINVYPILLLRNSSARLTSSEGAVPPAAIIAGFCILAARVDT